MTPGSIPLNSAAVEVRRRQEENVSLDEQMRVLREAQLQNSEMIGMLSTHAQWAQSEGATMPGEGTMDPEGPGEAEAEPESPQPEAPVDNPVDNTEEGADS